MANVEGTIYAVDDTCTHEDSSLALGCLRDNKVKCTLHGSWFSVVTGEPTDEPADEPLQRYPVEIKENESMGKLNTTDLNLFHIINITNT